MRVTEACDECRPEAATRPSKSTYTTYSVRNLLLRCSRTEFINRLLASQQQATSWLSPLLLSVVGPPVLLLLPPPPSLFFCCLPLALLLISSGSTEDVTAVSLSFASLPKAATPPYYYAPDELSQQRLRTADRRIPNPAQLAQHRTDSSAARRRLQGGAAEGARRRTPRMSSCISLRPGPPPERARVG